MRNAEEKSIELRAERGDLMLQNSAVLQSVVQSGRQEPATGNQEPVMSIGGSYGDNG
jgi:hypothetical protein